MSEVSLPNKVLCVEDEQTYLPQLEQFLERQGIRLIKAPDVGSAMYLFGQQHFEVALISLELKGVSGLVLAQKFRVHSDVDRAKIGIIVMHNKKTRSKGEENLTEEIDGIQFIPKPFQPVQLLTLLQKGKVWKSATVNYQNIEEKVFAFHDKTGKFDQAVEMIKKESKELGNKAPELLLKLYEKCDKHKEALDTVENLMRNSPKEDIKLINTKGRLLMKMGNFDEAQKWLEKADQLAPENLQRSMNMIDMYLKNNNPEASVKKMQELCQLSPEEPEKKFEFFSKLQEYGFDDHAAKYCRETTAPMEVVRHYNNKGVMMAKRKDYQHALAEYNSSIRLMPDFKEIYRIHFNKALALANVKKVSEAVEELELCLKINPSYEKAKTTLETLRPKKARKAG